MHKVREAVVSGIFYPSSKQRLTEDVGALLASVSSRDAEDESIKAKDVESVAQGYPKALIVPHAGYIYSGKTAAVAYKQLSAGRNLIKRVVLLGPAHRVSGRGLALPDVNYFSTPLGNVELDQDAIDGITGLSQVCVNPEMHAEEHSLEVQLPFLQTVLNDFKLVPLVVGNSTSNDVAEVLETLWGGEETLIIVSSDLSHYLPYGVAQSVDHETLQNIIKLKGALTPKQACGGTAVNGLILAARQRGLKPALLELCNSGDTAGDKDHVVGYASVAFTSATIYG